MNNRFGRGVRGLGSRAEEPVELAPDGANEGSEVEGLMELTENRGFLWFSDGGQRRAIVRIEGGVRGGWKTGMQAAGKLERRGGEWRVEVAGVGADDGPSFDELTSVSPKSRIRLETSADRLTTRVMDIVAPVGKGQRGLIVAPPRTGKTTLLRHIGEAVTRNHPEVHLIILLVDERPEEVTDLARGVPGAELLASSIDSDLEIHTRISVLAVERAKRLVEGGRDVVLLVDSLTRIGRAFNNRAGTGGRTMSGGVDSRALEMPRRLFAAARNTEEAGSLTILATALVGTESRMDELIFQEFKGTGNMEMVLDRSIAEKKIWPAVDIFLSGTRREELIVGPVAMSKVNAIRRSLAGEKTAEATERLVALLARHPDNDSALDGIAGD
jgi:transcription termination factor Rho